MAVKPRKIINDPVHGFITINDPLVLTVISHPYYQRLRRIYQMALAHLVYPGAVHTRLHHSLGAYHLIGNAIKELCDKGVAITAEEETAAKIAILLHDIGHGPFSHALENNLIPGAHHESIGLQIMHMMNEELGGSLTMAIEIFTDSYPKRFLHQLISGQLDVDRMDYLSRDSFFTGVSEGVIGYDRILKMLVVNNGQLMVEEKGIYSIEKFLVSRRLMYWQVYLHKTVLVAEKMLLNVISRVRAITPSPDVSLQGRGGENDLRTGTALDYFLMNGTAELNAQTIQKFCELDDYDVMHALKVWSKHPDKVLSLLCGNILNRKLLKIKLQAEPFDAALMQQKLQDVCQTLNLSEEEGKYLVFAGEAVNTMYKTNDERINILFKGGEVKDISQVDNALIHKSLASPIKKFYICFYE